MRQKQTDMKFPTILFSIIASLISFAAYPSAVQPNPKREFRGAWLHVMGQSQWQNKSTSQAKQYIIDQFDKLVDAGCNAVIFQVRPTADALMSPTLSLGRLGSQAKRKGSFSDVGSDGFCNRRGTQARDGVPCLAESLSCNLLAEGCASFFARSEERAVQVREVQRTDFLRPGLSREPRLHLRGDRRHHQAL